MVTSAVHGNSSLLYPTKLAAKNLMETASSSLAWANRIVYPIINRSIPHIISKYLPTISEFGGSIAGGIIGLSIGKFAADKLVAPENVKQWKLVCAAMTLVAYIGIMCSDPAFIGKSIASYASYRTLVSILGGIQGLKLAGAEIPRNETERRDERTDGHKPPQTNYNSFQSTSNQPVGGGFEYLKALCHLTGQGARIDARHEQKSATLDGRHL